MIHHYWGCGTCAEGRSGWPQLCSVVEPRIPTYNEHGAHGDFIRVPALQTLALPDTLSFKAGAALACGTGTTGGGLVRLGDVTGKNLVILG
jgi:D-arabinose 1-dehydrogenase-like Zn-dependent alcohol dehydrogenase